MAEKEQMKLPANVRDFIELVVKKMGYRRKVRADVRAELISHFEDALADCKDAGEKEKLTQQLISEFGDPKTLGRLMRRAKKRCRPIWKKAIIRSMQSVGLLVLFIGIYTVWFISGEPSVTKDYIAEMNASVRPEVDKSLNAGRLYVEAAERLKDTPEGIKDIISEDLADLSESKKQKLIQWLADNEKTFALLRRGSRKSYYWPVYEGDEDRLALSVTLDYLSGYRILVKALAKRAEYYAAEGDFSNALDDIETIIRIGRHLQGKGVLIEQLVAMSIQGIGSKSLRTIVSEHQIPQDVLASRQPAISGVLTSTDYTVSFATEKYFNLDAIQRTFTAGSEGHIIPPSITEYFGPDQKYQNNDSFGLVQFLMMYAELMVWHPDRQETLEAERQLLAFWQQVAELTPATIRRQNIDIEEHSIKIVDRNTLLYILMPAVEKVHSLSYRFKTGAAASSTVLTLVSYKQENGEYPIDLEQLVEAKYISALPLDPFSDQPLVYRKTGDDFILYSVGLDFDDDGGVQGEKLWAEEGDAVFWPVAEPDSGGNTNDGD